MNRIKELRKENGKTVAELAKELGISQSMLSNYENGNSTPRDSKIWDELATIFNVDVPYLMGLSHIRTFSDKDSFDEYYLSQQIKGSELITNEIHNLETGEIEYSVLNRKKIISSIFNDLSSANKDTLVTIAQALFKSQKFDEAVKKNTNSLD